MNKNAKISVRNRSTGSVGYTIPDMGNYKRKFMAGERKEISFEELQKLTYIPGGSYILKHYLVIENLEARDEILGNVELEYNYTDADIKNLLLYGSLDQLLDCLDFAPKGVIDLVQKYAVQLELNDLKKRKAIQDKTGFNISNAIIINEETNEQSQEKVAATRRVTEDTVNKSESEAPVRRVVVKK